jgi:hypothetical protein
VFLDDATGTDFHMHSCRAGFDRGDVGKEGNSEKLPGKINVFNVIKFKKNQEGRALYKAFLFRNFQVLCQAIQVGDNT